MNLSQDSDETSRFVAAIPYAILIQIKETFHQKAYKNGLS